MNPQKLEIGAIVQLNPETTRNKMLAGCFLVVTEEKSFGAMGYVQCTGENGEPGGQAYYRPLWEEMEPVNAFAVWEIK